MNKEPIRHHYIPQFILKNFCFNDRGQLFYYNKKTSQTSIKNTREIFMSNHLYRDEKNSVANPTKIESDLAVFECEVSKIIKDKFLSMDEILLSCEEDEKLKLFFAIMGFRSKNASNIFGLKATSDSKKFYSMYQKDGDLTDFWKRNLGFLANCRSLDDVLSHDDIDEPIKLFMRRDVFGLLGQYFIVGERKGKEKFLISDTYPTVNTGYNGLLPIHLYSFFPISPDRIILLASYGVQSTPRDFVFFRDCILNIPQIDPDKKTISIRVKKLYDEEVRYVNSSLLNAAFDGCAFKDREDIAFL